jgi:signal transduction histidine kinase
MSALPRLDRDRPPPRTLRVVREEIRQRLTAAGGFCGLVASVLACRRCSLMVAGLDGRLIVEEAVGFPAGLSGVIGAVAGNGLAERVAAEGRPLLVREPFDLAAWPHTDRRYATDSFICYPMTLPGGAAAVVNVTERVDGRPFDEQDVELLGRLAAYYVSVHDAPARREALRLRGELQRLRRQSIRVQEQERHRIARDLHDESGHTLSAAILRLDMLANAANATAPAEAIAVAKAALLECAEHLHETAFHLRPRVLLDLGTAPALRSLARRLRQAIAVEVRVYGEERRFGDDVELAIFRIAQEATTNALRHAQAGQLTISLVTTEETVVLEVSDDGIGLPCDDALWTRDHDGQGLRSMRERAELVDGVLEVLSQPGAGTTVRAILPIGGTP